MLGIFHVLSPFTIASIWSPRLPPLPTIIGIVLDGSAQTATALVEVLTILVSDLSTRLSSAVLPALLKSRIEIRPDDALVELGATDVLHAVERILVSVVFHEAEAARRLVEPIETHDQAFDLAALAKQLVDLLLGGVERAF